MVFADEIHGDLVLPPGRLVPFLSVCDGLDIEVVAANGLSKTMNLAGLGLSNLVIPSRGLRERFEDAVGGNGEWGVNPVSRAAALAGYAHGGAWLDALLDHIAGNMAFVDDWCAREFAGLVVPVKAEATYLKWLDTTRTGLDEEDLMDRLINGQDCSFRREVTLAPRRGDSCASILPVPAPCDDGNEPYHTGHRAGDRLRRPPIPP